MDEAMKRFPHLTEQIIQKMDNKGLVKSREVSRTWQEFVDAKEYPWLRIVRIPTRLKRSNCLTRHMCNTYLHLAAEYGQFGMFEWILEREAKVLQFGNCSSSFLVACLSGRLKFAEMLLKVA